jgi:hypothetical protein
MSFQGTIYKVMIASPSDVIQERTIIREVINEWNIINAYKQKIVLLPVGWETHTSPEMGNHPQEIINKQVLKDCDLLVGVFWTRIGTTTEDYISGTVEEIEEHIKQGKPAMLYFSSAPVVPDSIETEQYNSLKEFKNSLKLRGLIETYENINDFKSKFNRQLQLKINDSNYFVKNTNTIDELNITDTNIPNIPQLSNEAKLLLKEASKDRNGRILKLPTPPQFGGLNIRTNEKAFITDRSPKTRAIWEGAIQELENLDFIDPSGSKGHEYRVTRKGYDLAELLEI